jgi:hypothetical protein
MFPREIGVRKLQRPEREWFATQWPSACSSTDFDLIPRVREDQESVR